MCGSAEIGLDNPHRGVLHWLLTPQQKPKAHVAEVLDWLHLKSARFFSMVVPMLARLHRLAN